MRSAVRAEINVTPLVDVCLVLLIIFMVVTPLINAVQLPDAPEPEPWGTEPARSKIVLSYGPPVAVRVDDDPNPLDDGALAILLGAMHEADPRREIALRADRRLPYAEVKRILRAIQAARFPAVGLVAERTTAKR
ncbi:MAG TPA: biopolymer transporter ExbD [Thermoanaerobaculia bacterium]|nr:biopolymer transporter ExbD [Thermoanaerobaculia bacterium]